MSNSFFAMHARIQPPLSFYYTLVLQYCAYGVIISPNCAIQRYTQLTIISNQGVINIFKVRKKDEDRK